MRLEDAAGGVSADGARCYGADGGDCGATKDREAASGGQDAGTQQAEGWSEEYGDEACGRGKEDCTEVSWGQDERPEDGGGEGAGDEDAFYGANGSESGQPL
jgi:hypothetical protein